jgi:hypothetical protein
MLRRRAAQCGMQWDKHLPGVLWAYRNTPHNPTGEKLFFLLFGWDCKSPSKAAMLPPVGAQPTAVADYRQELIESLSKVRQTALHSISHAQRSTRSNMIARTSIVRETGCSYFTPAEKQEGSESYQDRGTDVIIESLHYHDTGVSAIKVYFPREDAVKNH